MQGSGFKFGLVIFFVLLSAWYLYPSVQSYYYTKELQEREGEEREAYLQEHFGDIREVQDKALKLGLDLQGGMHVTLEVGLAQLIRELAQEQDQTFNEVLSVAQERSGSGDVSLIDAFVQEFERRDPNARLSRYFRAPDAGITRRSSNAEVAEYLRTESEEAVTRAIEIIRNRVDRFGVTEPSIARQGSRRVVVELPGVDDPERVRNLLRGTARLEFRLMHDDVGRSLQQLIEHFEEDVAAGADTTAGAATDAPGALAQADTAAATNTTADTTAPAPPAGADTAALARTEEADSAVDVSTLLNQNQEERAAGNPLLEVLQPIGQGVLFGRVAEQDTAQFNALMRSREVEALLPPSLELLYSANPVATSEDGQELFDVIAVREEIELTGDVITDARVDFSDTNLPQVSMTMNTEGARTWARLTGANVGRNIAIVLDEYVYSYPVVQDRIVGGRSQITGLDSREEAQDVVTVLKSGALPAPVQIVEERTVGPSLGRASINDGFLSVILGFLLVSLFMIFFYRTAGLIADLALIFNLLFILGILAAFNATLTLPGIGGIVLTIGMAVDANVLIYERIREELDAGKTMKAALDAGYSKAFSAIFDSNITTFFVGVILYSFGVGPIQGFAVTLMAGILASFFTAIVITRLIFDYLILSRRTSVSYG